MKTFIKTLAFLVIVIAGTWLLPQKVSAQNEPVSLQVFYDELSPYGTWVDSPDYGYVWVPNVDQDFSPYVTNGHWVFTDYGWTWVSDYPWGWAPFHYGRWAIDPQYGNIWIPDTEWGPAWVTWRQANGYIGWTPMGPGINIDMAMGSSYYVPQDRWAFVRDRDFMQNDLYRYRLDRSLIFNIFNMSLVLRNTRFDNDRHSTYFFGPSRDDVQRYSGRVINPVHIRDYDRPGQTYDQGYLNIYRPQMKRMSVNGQMPAPRNVNRNMDVRSQLNRNSYNQGRISQPVQQNNPNKYGNQREVQQNSRNANTYNQPRNVQQYQQPNQARNVQQNQQPNQVRNVQQNQQSYQARNVQQARQQAVNQQQNQRNQRPVQNVNPTVNNRQQQTRAVQNQPSRSQQPSANVRQQQAKMVVNPDRNKREESRK